MKKKISLGHKPVIFLLYKLSIKKNVIHFGVIFENVSYRMKIELASAYNAGTKSFKSFTYFVVAFNSVSYRVKVTLLFCHKFLILSQGCKYQTTF